jgi:hypothetical protein
MKKNISIDTDLFEKASITIYNVKTKELKHIFEEYKIKDFGEEEVPANDFDEISTVCISFKNNPLLLDNLSDFVTKCQKVGLNNSRGSLVVDLSFI